MELLSTTKHKELAKNENNKVTYNFNFEVEDQNFTKEVSYEIGLSLN